MSRVEYTPSHNDHVGAFFQNHLPRTPPSLSKPIASTAARLVFRFETLSAVRRKADTGGEIQESVLWRRVQCLLRDKADDEFGVFSGGRQACARVCGGHEVTFAAHLREQQETPRVGGRPQVLQRLFTVARAGAFAGGERALEGEDVGGRWLVCLGDGGDGRDNTPLAVESQGRGGKRVFIIFIFAGGSINGQTRGPGGDFCGDGLIKRGQSRDGSRLER